MGHDPFQPAQVPDVEFVAAAERRLEATRRTRVLTNLIDLSRLGRYFFVHTMSTREKSQEVCPSV